MINLRMLKGTSWGASKQPLLSLYRTFIWPVIEYGMEAYFFSALLSVDPILKFKMKHCAYALVQ